MFIKRSIILLAVLVLVSIQPQNILAAEVGYKDGCKTGKFVAGDGPSWVRNNKLFFSDGEYKKGWEKGFFKCLGDLEETEKTKQAVQLAKFDNEVANAELTAYFSMLGLGHKAFALNPLNKGNYYWIKEKSTKESAINTVLKSGTQCILFATDDEIVWKEELDKWKKKYLEENLSKKLDQAGNTIFHYLGCYENLLYLERAIKNLISVGEIGILNIKNRQGQTAEDMARLYGNKTSVKMLKNAKKK